MDYLVSSRRILERSPKVQDDVTEEHRVNNIVRQDHSAIAENVRFEGDVDGDRVTIPN